MGSSQSTDRVSISREDEAYNIVRISEDAIRTLRGERTPPPGDTAPPQREKPSPPPVTIAPPPSAPPPPAFDEKLQSALNDERLLSQRLRQDLKQRQQEINELRKKASSFEREAKDIALSATVGDSEQVKQAESYYRQKLDELLERERRRQEEAAKQFKDSLERLQQRFLKYSCHTACADVESKVLQCYLQNPKQPLQCWKEGDEFIQCVDEYRAKMLTAKEMRVSSN